MAVISSVRATYDEIRFLRWNNFTNGVYVAVGLPFTQPVRMLKVHNFTDVNIAISFDGVTDHDVMARQSDYVDDYCSNQSFAGGLLELPAGFRYYVQGMDDDGDPIAPTSGSIWVTIVYADSR